MRYPRTGRRGSILIEFTLVAIPLIFVVISVAQMSLLMWRYHTLAEAVKATTRAVSSHGPGCVTYPACALTIGTVSKQLAAKAVAIPAGSINATFASAASTVTCVPLTACTSSTTVWPSLSGNIVGTTDVTITAYYRTNVPIGMWSPRSGGMMFSPATIAATSRLPVAF
jgi:Flp pilus assembly protein TadG